MRSCSLLVLVICGCSDRAPAPVSKVRKAPIQQNVVDANTRKLGAFGDVVASAGITFELGDTHEIVAPAGSATAGSTWIETTVTYTNGSDHSIWVLGYSVDKPFYAIETRPASTEKWLDYELGFCGTGARDFEIDPGETHSFQVALPERFVNHEFRVLLSYRMATTDLQWAQLASDPRRLE